jgi:hypothetical protein
MIRDGLTTAEIREKLEIPQQASFYFAFVFLNCNAYSN